MMLVKTYGEPVSKRVPADTPAPWLDADSEKSRLTHDWRCDLDGVPFCVPAGYVTDWASIPRIMQWLYPPDYEGFRQAALLHDYLYSHLWPLFSKKFADRAFRAILKRDGVPVWRRWAFYCAVRVGGRGGWHRVNDTDADPFWRDQQAKMLPDAF